MLENTKKKQVFDKNGENSDFELDLKDFIDIASNQKSAISKVQESTKKLRKLIIKYFE